MYVLDAIYFLRFFVWKWYYCQRRVRPKMIYETRHNISNNVVCETSKRPDQPGHKRSLNRAFAGRLDILLLLSYWLNIMTHLWVFSYWRNIIWSSNLKSRLRRLVWVYTCQNSTLLTTTCRGSCLSSETSCLLKSLHASSTGSKKCRSELTLKAPRKKSSENVVCWSRPLQIIA